MEKKYYLAKHHLYESNGSCFVFLPEKHRLYEADRDTYNKIAKLSDTYGTDKTIADGDGELLEAGILEEAELPTEGMKALVYEAARKAMEESDTLRPLTNKTFADF